MKKQEKRTSVWYRAARLCHSRLLKMVNPDPVVLAMLTAAIQSGDEPDMRQAVKFFVCWDVDRVQISLS